jgi:hypothetical protein
MNNHMQQRITSKPSTISIQLIGISIVQFIRVQHGIKCCHPNGDGLHNPAQGPAGTTLELARMRRAPNNVTCTTPPRHHHICPPETYPHNRILPINPHNGIPHPPLGRDTSSGRVPQLPYKRGIEARRCHRAGQEACGRFQGRVSGYLITFVCADKRWTERFDERGCVHVATAIVIFSVALDTYTFSRDNWIRCLTNTIQTLRFPHRCDYSRRRHVLLCHRRVPRVEPALDRRHLRTSMTCQCQYNTNNG